VGVVNISIQLQVHVTYNKYVLHCSSNFRCRVWVQRTDGKWL